MNSRLGDLGLISNETRVRYDWCQEEHLVKLLVFKKNPSLMLAYLNPQIRVKHDIKMHVCFSSICLSLLCRRGVINSVASKGTSNCPIAHCYTAVGHSKAVLSLFAVDDLLFTGSKGT